MVWVTGLAIAIPLGGIQAPSADSSSSLLKTQIVFVEAPQIVAGNLIGRFPRGSRIVRLSTGEPRQRVVNLTPEFFSAADPEMSFDATKMLFSGQTSRGSLWQIWEMNVDGSGKRQLTRCSDHCIRAAYLPPNQIVYSLVSARDGEPRSALFVSREDGTDAHAITFGPGNFQVETVLRNGRILASADSPLRAGGRAGGSRAFYTMRPDGSELTLFREDRRPDIFRATATQLDDGTLLFVERTEPGVEKVGGQLAWIQLGALHNSMITPPDSVYESPRELDGDTVVVARANRRSTASSRQFDLYAFDLKHKTLGPVIFRDPGFSSFQAIPVAPHPAPLLYPSILHPQLQTGRIVCLNAYTTADEASGHFDTALAKVRVIALQPDHHQERTLGEAPVETDGSFYITVPANQPIRFELLNASGRVVSAQRSWIWARNGEDVACIGCHESKAVAPANRWPLALKRMDAPIPVGVNLTQAASSH